MFITFLEHERRTVAIMFTDLGEAISLLDSQTRASLIHKGEAIAAAEWQSKNELS